MIFHSVPKGGVPGAARVALGSRRQHLLFLCSCLSTCVVFRGVAAAVATLALHDDRYTFILAIPPLVLGLIWLKRDYFFAEERQGSWMGTAIVMTGLIFYGIVAWLGLNKENSIFFQELAVVAIVVGSFVWCYGTKAAQAAAFPLTLLFLTVPVQSHVLDHIVVALQQGSAAVSYQLLRLAGVPVLRDSAVRFTLPGFTIEVAQECSGIRSSLSLFVSSLVAGYLLLCSSWSRIAFSAITLPIVILKNALRIVTLSLLGAYVDPGFLYGRLHRYSGLPFSLVALALLFPFLFWLMRIDRGSSPLVEKAALAPNSSGTSPKVDPDLEQVDGLPARSGNIDRNKKPR